MCDLVALSRAEAGPLSSPIGGLIPMAALKGLSPENPDGWGLAAWGDLGLFHVKAPEKASESAHYGFLEGAPVGAHTALLHLRQSSVGNNRFENTHPFVRPWGNTAIAFMHNGTLKDFEGPLAARLLEPVGDTDSERAFCFLLDRGTERDAWPPGDDEAFFRRLEFLCREVNQLGKFNAGWSDGRRLFLYRDRDGYNGLHSQTGPGWALFSSKPLGPGPWAEMPREHLQVYARGERIY